VSEVQIEDVRNAINVADWSPTMRNNERRAVHSFFAWAVDQGYCPENPVTKVQSPKIERGEPKVLRLAEVVAFLRAARDYKDGVLLPFIVLSLFCGARPTELRRISWDDIDLENRVLTIRGAAAKLRQRRLVELSANLVGWLLPCRGRSIFDKNFRRNFDAVRRASGYKGSHPKKGDENLRQWVNDLFRHTSLSFHLAYNRHEGETADWGGTSVVMLHQHYKGLVRRTDAELYWSVTPESLDDVNLIEMPKVVAA